VGALSEAFRLIVNLDPEVMAVTATSLQVSLAAVTLAAFIGLPLAFVLAFRIFPGRNIVRLLLNTLMALPTVVVGLVTYGMIGRQGALGEWGLLFTPTGIVIGQFLLCFPIVTNLAWTALASGDPRLLLACRTLGGGSWREGWLIARELRTGILAAVVAGFGRVVAEVGVAMMVGGNIKGYTRTMTTAIALETSKGEFEFALALGLLLLGVALAVNLALTALGRER
jgi:tungstate transport system permease protein